MKVVGITTQQEVFVGSKDRNFRINEFLIIEDPYQNDLLGEVVEAQTFNRYIPLNIHGDMVDSSVLESLKSLGYNIDEERGTLSSTHRFRYKTSQVFRSKRYNDSIYCRRGSGFRSYKKYR